MKVRYSSGLLALAVALVWLTVMGASDWCVTPAYGFLSLAYGAMWFSGHWFAPRHTLAGKGLFEVFSVAAMASTLAFVISNVSFYMFSGRYAEMSAVEYSSRVAQYWGSYVGVALLYVACVIAAQMVITLLKGKTHTSSGVV